MRPQESSSFPPERGPLTPPQMQRLMNAVLGRLAKLLNVTPEELAKDEKVQDELRASIREDIDRIFRVEISTDTAYIRNVLGAFLYLIPSHDHSPFPELKSLFANAKDHPSLTGLNAVAVKIIPAAESWEWVETDGQEPQSIRGLFEDRLRKLPSKSLKAMRRVTLFRLVEQARSQGVETELISLMGLFIDVLDQMTRDRVQEFHRHQPESTDAHQQLITTDERIELKASSARANLIPSQATEAESGDFQARLQKRYDLDWDQRRQMAPEKLWPIQLPAAANRLERGFDRTERDFEKALGILFPIAPVDVFHKLYYLWGLLQGAENENHTFAQELGRISLAPLLSMRNNQILGSFQGNASQIQLLSLPEASEVQQRRAFVNRVALFMLPFAEKGSYELGEFPDDEKEHCIGEREMWWIYGQLREAIQNSESLVEVLEKLLPGIEYSYLMKGHQQDLALKRRFQDWAKIVDSYFNQRGHPEIALVMEAFFYSLANETPQQWSSKSQFYHIKTAWSAEIDDADELEQAHEWMMENTELLFAIPVKQFKRAPNRLNDIPLIEAWRKNDAQMRLELAEHVVKRHPALENFDGQVIMNAAEMLPFTPSLPHGMFSLPVIRGGQIYWVWWPEVAEMAL